MGGAAIGVLALWTEIILNESRVVGGVGGAGGWGAQGGTVGIRGFGGAGGGGAAGNGGPAIGVALASAGFSGQGDYYYPGAAGSAGRPGSSGYGPDCPRLAPSGASGTDGPAAASAELTIR
jgi:hypothetical protein